MRDILFRYVALPCREAPGRLLSEAGSTILSVSSEYWLHPRSIVRAHAAQEAAATVVVLGQTRGK
jgi:hypothetical protein